MIKELIVINTGREKTERPKLNNATGPYIERYWTALFLTTKNRLSR